MFFYYDDFKNIYKTRYEAILSKNHCWFYWHDNELDKVNWGLEPKQPLSELYRERAEWIRSNYEYIILAYSGGIDSLNVLETFYYNNIHIDEILCVGALSQPYYEGTDKNTCEDLYLNAFPTLNKFSLPNTKITVDDYTDYFNNINNFEILKKYGNEWYKDIGSYYSITHYYWNNLKNKYRDKQVGIIFGTDKPYVFTINNKLYTQFNDRQMFDYGNISYTGNFQRVNFYTSPNSFELIKKQLHTIINFQKQYNKKNNIIDIKYLNDDRVVKKLIYGNLKNFLSYQVQKSKSNILSVRDMFILMKTNSDIYKIYRDGLKHFQNSVKVDIKNTGFFKTKSYYICDL